MKGYVGRGRQGHHGSRRHAPAMREYVVFVKENCEAILSESSLPSDDLGPACSHYLLITGTCLTYNIHSFNKLEW